MPSPTSRTIVVLTAACLTVGVLLDATHPPGTMSQPAVQAQNRPVLAASGPEAGLPAQSIGWSYRLRLWLLTNRLRADQGLDDLAVPEEAQAIAAALPEQAEAMTRQMAVASLAAAGAPQALFTPATSAATGTHSPATASLAELLALGSVFLHETGVTETDAGMTETEAVAPTGGAGSLPAAFPTAGLWPGTGPVALNSASATGGPDADPSGETSAVPAVRLPLPSDLPINLLLLGSDKRPEERIWRTDTLVVASLDPKTGRVGVLSVPRDLWVEIPGHGEGRINTADYLGHVDGQPDGELVKATLAVNLGIPIHRFVRVDMQSFVDVVDALGGIDVTVDCPMKDILHDANQAPGDASTGAILSPGVHHLDGQTALAFARSRNQSSDFARARRQQRVLRGVLEKTHGSEIAPKVLELYGALQGRVSTDLSLREIIALALLATKLTREDIHTQVMDHTTVQDWVTPDGAQVLLINPETTAGMLEDSFDPARTNAPRIKVAIVDATGSPGLAAVAQTRLVERGFNAVLSGQRPPNVPSSLFVAPDSSGQAAARAVAAAVGVDDAMQQPNESLTPADRAKGDVVLVIGADWNPCPSGD